jgi:hypothetical protein
MDFINGFVLHNDDDEEEYRQKQWKKVDGAAADSKAVKSLKSVIRGRIVEFTVWMVKATFGFDGDKDIEQMTFPTPSIASGTSGHALTRLWQ